MNMNIPMRRLTMQMSIPADTSKRQELPTLHELPALQDLTAPQELPALQEWGNSPRVGVRSKGWVVAFLVGMLTGSIVVKAQERSVVHTSQQWAQVYTQLVLN